MKRTAGLLSAAALDPAKLVDRRAGLVGAARMMRLALFDLDNTLLTGDSEVLWVEFLLARGVLDAALAARNAELDRRYHAGQVAPDAFCAFYAAIFGGQTPGQWAAWLDAFVQEVVLPRLPQAAYALVQQHRAAGDRLVLTTASSRFLAQPSASALGIADLIATELAQHADGRFTGQVQGVPNMREGKLARLRQWLAAQGMDADAELARAVFYSDSVNDLPLLLAVGEPVAVDPDARLAQQAAVHRWPVLRLARADGLAPAGTHRARSLAAHADGRGLQTAGAR